MHDSFSIPVDLDLIKSYQNYINKLMYKFNAKYHGTPIDFKEEWLKNNYPDGEHSFQIQSVIVENGVIQIEYNYLDKDDEDIYKDSMAIEQFVKYAKLYNLRGEI